MKEQIDRNQSYIPFSISNNYIPQVHKKPTPVQGHLCYGEVVGELFWHHPVCVQHLPVPPDQDAC